MVPNNKPKRSLSAYNLYFQMQSERWVNGDSTAPCVESETEHFSCDDSERPAHTSEQQTLHTDSSFEEMARMISDGWKNLGHQEKDAFNAHADADHKRYLSELKVWRESNEKTSSVKVNHNAKGKSLSTMARPNRPPLLVKQSVATQSPWFCSRPDTTIFAKPQDYSMASTLTPSKSINSILQNGVSLLQNPISATTADLEAQLRALEHEFARQAKALHLSVPAPMIAETAPFSTTKNTTDVETTQTQSVPFCSIAISPQVVELEDVFYDDCEPLNPFLGLKTNDPFEPRPMGSNTFIDDDYFNLPM